MNVAPVQKSSLSGGKPDKNALQMVIHNPNDNVSVATRRGDGLKRGSRVAGFDKGNNSKMICIRAYRVFCRASRRALLRLAAPHDFCQMMPV